MNFGRHVGLFSAVQGEIGAQCKQFSLLCELRRSMLLVEKHKRIWRWLSHFHQCVHVTMLKELDAATHQQHCFPHIAPAAIGIEGHLDAVGVGAESFFQKGG